MRVLEYHARKSTSLQILQDFPHVAIFGTRTTTHHAPATNQAFCHAISCAPSPSCRRRRQEYEVILRSQTRCLVRPCPLHNRTCLQHASLCTRRILSPASCMHLHRPDLMRSWTGGAAADFYLLHMHACIVLTRPGSLTPMTPTARSLLPWHWSITRRIQPASSFPWGHLPMWSLVRLISSRASHQHRGLLTAKMHGKRRQRGLSRCTDC